jgi:hypothetical protein
MYRRQHGRKTVGPRRQASKAPQAPYITESRREHAVHGWHRAISEYTPDAETHTLVTALLQQAA